MPCGDIEDINKENLTLNFKDEKFNACAEKIPQMKLILIVFQTLNKKRLVNLKRQQQKLFKTKCTEKKLKRKLSEHQ